MRLRAAVAFLGRVNPLLRPRRRGAPRRGYAVASRPATAGGGGSSLVAASTAARCGDNIVPGRRCDETFGAGAAPTTGRRAIHALSAPRRFSCLQRPEELRYDRVLATIGSFVNAAALRIVSELAKPVERSARVPNKATAF